MLSEEEGKTLSSMAGLRNVPVHMYSDYGLLYNHALELLEDAPKIAAKLLRALEELDC
ncbi:MAG: hypothetical protein GXO07_05570 [Crenarchaeota archaeon]|nr:hypothetical protein [Thermoproteota archaeon]